MVNIRRAYGNWKKPSLAGWRKVLHEYCDPADAVLRPGKGENATDMALLIDAMDILYTKKVNTFCLVSSDSDFTPLIQRLRADGKEVFGFGEGKLRSPFKTAARGSSIWMRRVKRKLLARRRESRANGGDTGE